MARYDVLIRGATVYDGSGGVPFEADVAIDGERIAAIGSLDGASAALEVDGSSHALAPGFIDVHTHDDFACLQHPDMAFKTRGGVTTCIVGNCGFGAAPHAAALEMIGALAPAAAVPDYAGHAGYLAALEAARPALNVGMLAGHGTLRLAAMGRAARAPEAAELRAMEDALDEALEAGALGLSSGLIYEPGRYAATEELIALARRMRGTGALYASHLRDEAAGLVDAVGEAIAIGEAAGVPVQISHHKAAGRDNWGRVAETLRLIESAQARGLAVHADQYPYTAGSTLLRAVLDNGAFRDDVAPGGIGRVTPDDVVVAAAPGQAGWEGQSIAALAGLLGLAPRAAAEHVVAHAPGATAIIHMMSEDDVQAVLRHPSTMIGSDGIPTLDGRPHPRLYNTFARVLGHYVRDLGVLPLAEAVHRMTGFAAAKFGLVDRGTVRAGAFADLVLFDPATVIDRGTFEAPNRYPAGIVDVFVNGARVVAGGVPTAARPGRVLRRAG
ncbi:MAG: D-aminoacylase [Gammaproteobacteria bacterium]|nr:D-aminoacylase [Gammaproteobacteria bacterium]